METYSLIVDAPGLSNLGMVDSKVYRSASPTEEGYRTLREMGIRTVVNLQEESFAPVVEIAGMKEMHFPTGLLEKIPVQKLLTITTLLNSNSYAPCLVHCREGHDRTGAVCFAYRLRFCGWTEAAAWEEAERYGYKKFWIELTASINDFIKWLAEMKTAAKS